MQSSRFPERLSNTASPTEERRLCNAESPPRSFRLRRRCSCAGVLPAVLATGPALDTFSSGVPVAAVAPPTDDRRDTSSKYYQQKDFTRFLLKCLSRDGHIVLTQSCSISIREALMSRMQTISNSILEVFAGMLQVN